MAAGLILFLPNAQAQTQLFWEDFESPDPNWDFQPDSDTARWKVNNSGGVGNSRSLRCSRVTNAAGSQADKYFAVFPGLALTNGHHYTIRFQSKIAQANARRMKLAFNTTPSRNGATLIQDFDTLVASETFQTYSASFTANSTQTHYFILYGDNLLAHADPVLWYVDDVEVFRDNQLPEVSITFPVNMAQLPEGPTTLTATASDPDGSIARVVFYVDEDSVGQDITSPYSLTTYLYPKEEEGQKTYLHARAYDNAGAYAQTTINMDVLANTCDLEMPETSKQIICSYDSVEFHPIANNGGKKCQWQYWQANQWQENTGDTLAHCYKKPGIFRARITYPNGATCYTRVDTVSTLQIEIPTVYVYGSAPVLATVIASGGAEPYSYSWSSHDTCLNASCDSVLVSDVLNPIVVTVTDQLGCGVSDTVEVNYPCQAQSLGQKDLEETVGNLLEFKNEQESRFQNDIEREIANGEAGLGRPAEGIGTNELVIPIVVFIANNHLDTMTINGKKVPPNGIKNTINARPWMIKNFVDTINSYLANNPVIIGGVSKTFRICFARKDTAGQDIDSVSFVDYQGLIPYGFADTLHLNFPKITPNNYLRITIGPDTRGSSWGYLASSIFYRKNARHDGIHITSGMFGPIPTSPSIPYFPRNTVNATGASFLHELGHYFDLQHTFEPSDYDPRYPCISNANSNCRAYNAELAGKYYDTCSFKVDTIRYKGIFPQWDFVKDTPPQSIKWASSNGCDTIGQPLSWRRCSSYSYISHPIEALIGNAISNSKNECVDKAHGGKAFTKGQLERMYYALQYYRRELVSPENLVRTGVKCKQPLAQFTYNRDYVCGTGTSAQLKVKSLDNQAAGLVYKWTVTGGSATFSPADSTPGVKTIQFTTSTSGIATLTLQVKSGGAVIKSTSIPVYVHSDCGSVQPHKKNMFFGTYAGLNFNNDTVLFPRPDTSMYNPDTFIVRSTGGTVTYNDPVTGKMKFYATGKRIWNSQLQLQSGVILSTNEGTSQYGIAVPSPSDSSRVWFFTVPNSDSAINSSAGLRWHKVRPKNLADSSHWNLAVPFGTNPSAGGSARVNEKITAIPKGTCSRDGYWLISQGAKGTANAGKFLVFRVTDTVATPVTYSAKFASKTGFIKPSPLGNKILVTYSDRDSSFGGYGTGKNARVFNFNRQTGAIDTNAVELRIPGLPSGTTEAATYGCAFSPDGTKAFINVNAKDYKSGSGTGATYHVLAGIYQFDLTSASNPITGVRISRIPQNINPSLDMMTGPDGMIYLSSTVSVGLRKFLKEFNLTQNFIPESGGALGVIHFPDAATPGLSWDGPNLAKRPDQNILSTGGLSNFLEMPVEVVVPEHGLTQSDPKDLGTNPTTCCGYPVYTQNIACTGNDNGTAGNDFYYKFTVDQICGTDYPGVVIKTCGTDFPVNTKIWAKKPNGDWSDDPLSTDYYSVSNCSGGNGQIFEMKDLGNEDFFPTDAFKRPFEFLVEADAQSPSASGNFKTKIQIQEDYEYFDGFDIVACELPTSCCRIAVDVEGQKPENSKVSGLIKPMMKLVPNPAKDRLTIHLEGLEPEAILNVSDGLGREVLQLKVGEQTELDIRNLAKGIYKVRARDNLVSVFKTLIVE